MYNHKVIEKWEQGKRARSFTGNLHTDGCDLYSYELKIGYTNEDGERIVKLYTAVHGNFKSKTTSKHVNKARVVADYTERVSG
jgi:hypothetical protein